MNDNAGAKADRDALLETFVAELTRAAYHVALRHGAAGTWLDLELDLWQALADTVKQWGAGGRLRDRSRAVPGPPDSAGAATGGRGADLGQNRGEA